MVPPDVVTLACVSDTEEDDSDTVDGWLRLVEGVATKSRTQSSSTAKQTRGYYSISLQSAIAQTFQFEVFTCSGEFAFAALSFLSNVFETFLNVTLKES